VGSSSIDELRGSVLDRCRSPIELGHPCLGGVLVFFRVDAPQQGASDPETLSHRKIQRLGEHLARIGHAPSLARALDHVAGAFGAARRPSTCSSFELEAADGAEPMSKRALRAVARAELGRAAGAS
jgi:hypothetical protein